MSFDSDRISSTCVAARSAFGNPSDIFNASATFCVITSFWWYSPIFKTVLLYR